MFSLIERERGRNWSCNRKNGNILIFKWIFMFKLSVGKWGINFNVWRLS